MSKRCNLESCILKGTCGLTGTLAQDALPCPHDGKVPKQGCHLRAEIVRHPPSFGTSMVEYAREVYGRVFERAKTT